MYAKLKDALRQNAELRTRIGEAETEAKTATEQAKVGKEEEAFVQAYCMQMSLL